MTAPTHDHPHSHGDAHHHPLPPSGDGTVMLDIGEGVGALVVRAPASLAGIEIELARVGEHHAFTHTEVRERILPDGTVYAGVYPAIVAGNYTLLDVDGAPHCALTITAGAVTEVAW